MTGAPLVELGATNTVRRVVLALALVMLGFLVGLAAVSVHGWWWGLALGAGASAAIMVALPPAWLTRPMFAVGWLVPLGLGVVLRSEGDYLVSSDPRGYILIGVGVALLLGGIPYHLPGDDRRPGPEQAIGGDSGGLGRDASRG